MKLLILGKDGQVGRALRRALADRSDAVFLGRAEADLEGPERLADVVGAQRPDVVINAAAYTAVDAAEDDAERARTVNALAVGAIGEAARQQGALVVHYSTDYVYAGTAAGYQSEAEPTAPRSRYGIGKLEGETLLAGSGARHIIVRTSWVYAPEGKNFPLTILRLAKERPALTVVADQVGAPTSAGLIAAVTAKLIEQPAGREGIYNLAPSGEVSWYGLAQFLIAEAIASGAQLAATPEAVKPIAARDYPAKAPRPANSRLDTSKLRGTFGIALPPWQDDVRQLIRTLRAEGRL